MKIIQVFKLRNELYPSCNFFLIFSFLYLLSNSHRSFHVEEEPIIYLFIFECEIKLYMLGHGF
jgi:hypothetical protein